MLYKIEILFESLRVNYIDIFYQIKRDKLNFFLKNNKVDMKLEYHKETIVQQEILGSIINCHVIY